MQQLYQGLSRVDQALADSNISLPALHANLNTVRQLQEDLSHVDASSRQKQLVNDRISQLIIDIQLLIYNYKEPVRVAVAPVAKSRTRAADFEESHHLMDETIELANVAQTTLSAQGEHLRRIHEKVLQLTNYIDIGGRTVTQILHIERLGNFLRVGGVVALVVLLLLIKFCF